MSNIYCIKAFINLC